MQEQPLNQESSAEAKNKQTPSSTGLDAWRFINQLMAKTINPVTNHVAIAFEPLQDYKRITARLCFLDRCSTQNV